MKIIGLCGGSGSGKGMVSSLFVKAGIPVIDADAVYHELTAKSSDCLLALCEEFGDGILSGGALNRKALADIVFSSSDAPKKRKRLNEISHSFILSEIERRLRSFEKEGIKLAVVDAPLLFESGFDKKCDITVAVISDEDTRISRIMFRDNLTEEEAARRIKAQISNSELIERSDFQIYNNGTVEDLTESMHELIEKINQ